MPPDVPAIVTAMSLEARAVRRRVAHANVIESGIGLAKMNRRPILGVAISCGLAGGLRTDLPSGTIVIPSAVATNAGTAIACDAEWTARLREAAKQLGCAYIDAALLTSDTLVVGNARAAWAARGFAAVDMETARIPAQRIAAVRVILDTPQRELSPDWVNPARAMLKPRNWGQMFWLAREGPRCADIAACVIAAAL
jgi:hypothetical protein